MIKYPFPFPEHLIPSLPKPAKDGNHYVDVRFQDRWNGILVVDARGIVIGIHVRRRIEEYPLPFKPTEIQGVRPASLYNRFLAAIPFDLWFPCLISILIISPLLLTLGFAVHKFFLLGVIPLCCGAIVLMYESSGFPLIQVA